MSISKEEFDLFRVLINNKCGIALDESKDYLVENRLNVLMIQSGCETFKEFYKKVVADEMLAAKVVDAIVTNETLWFRDEPFFNALHDKVIPWLAEKAKTSRVRIWSVACSTGQEPYSVAMLIDEACVAMNNKGAKGNIQIIASDISPSAIFMAVSGRYTKLAISRGMREEYLDKYFNYDGRVYELDETIRSMVSFKQINLLDDFQGMGSFDLVMCRNILIYFSDDLKSELYGKLHNSLFNGGLLAIGGSEASKAYSDDFDQVLIDRAMFYTPKGSNVAKVFA